MISILNQRPLGKICLVATRYARLTRHQNVQRFATASESISISNESTSASSYRIGATTVVNLNATMLRKNLEKSEGKSQKEEAESVDEQDIAGIIKKTENRLGFNADMLLIMATPAHSVALSEYIGKLNNGTQAIGAIVDSLAYGSQRNGISALLLKDLSKEKRKMEITEAIKLQTEEEQMLNSLGKPSVRGVRTARNPWTQTQAYLSISIPTGGKDATVTIPLANTIFNSGVETTLLHNKGQEKDEARESANAELFSSLHIRLPFFNVQQGSNAVECQGIYTPISSVLSTKSVAPLIKLTTGGPHKITAVKTNMLKKIDNKPAAGFLESCVSLMAPKPGSSADVPDKANERKVFATVIEKEKAGEKGKASRFEVIAGGGGSWSPRASMLVLDPHASPSTGDTIEFYLSENSEIFEKGVYQKLLKENGVEVDSEKVGSEENGVKLVMECAPVLEEVTGYESKWGLIDYAENSELEGVFTFGSEQGFLVEDVKYTVPGEILEIKS